MALAYDNPAEPAARLGDLRQSVLRRAAAPWLWGATGFFLGALFWHFIGFWSFVSNVVFNARTDAPALVQRRAEPLPTFLKTPPAARVGACVKLVRDRQAGATTKGDCLTSDPPLRNYGLARRGDLAVISTGWSITSR
jgi:hypothetical protein